MKNLKIIFFCTLVMFFSCEREKIEPQKIDNDTVESINSQIEIENAIAIADDAIDNISIYSNVFAKSSNSQISDKENKRSNFFRNCVDIMTISSDDSVKMVYTFTGECENRDGNLISGTITRISHFVDGGSQNTLSFENLKINGLLINGTKTQTWNINNENGNPEIRSTVDLEVVSSLQTITKTGNGIVEIIEGGDTRTFSDDVKSITGSFTYTGFENGFSTDITLPLIKPADCRFIVSGIKTYLTLTNETILDYGDSSCDEFTSLTFPDGSQTEIIIGNTHDQVDLSNEDMEQGEEDELNTSRCVITTECEEVVLDDVSNLSITVNQGDGVFNIVAKNLEGQIVYEAQCDAGPNVSVSCSSQSNDDQEDGNEESVDEEDEDDNDEAVDEAVDEAENDEEENDEEDIDDNDQMTTGQCTLTTQCEEVVIENVSDISVNVTESNGMFVIVAVDQKGEIVYEGSCDQGPNVSVNCGSQGNDGEDFENQDEEEENDDAEQNDEQSNDSDDEDEMITNQCTIKTLCEEVIIENVSDISVEVTENNGVFIIKAINREGEIVYNGECTQGPDVSVICSSGNIEDDFDFENLNMLQCTITTACEEVVIDNTSVIDIEVNETNGAFIIIGRNQDGIIVYEGTCDVYPDVKLQCKS